MKDRGQVAFEAYDEPGCKWAFQSAAERERWARVERAVIGAPRCNCGASTAAPLRDHYWGCNIVRDVEA
jgi:hypothetical protein